MDKNFLIWHERPYFMKHGAAETNLLNVLPKRENKTGSLNLRRYDSNFRLS